MAIPPHGVFVMTDTMARISKKSLETIRLNTNSIDERQTQRGDLFKFTQASVRPRLDPYLLTSSPVLKTRGTARCRGERLLRTIFYALP